MFVQAVTAFQERDLETAQQVLASNDVFNRLTADARNRPVGLMAEGGDKRLAKYRIAVPIVNVPGFLNLSRYLPDRRDLNRSFPGSAKGSLAARLAKLFLDEIVTGSTHGIDLHTGAVHRDNYPQIRASLDDAQAERMARAFGVPIVVNSDFRNGSLRAAAHNLGVPVIVYEAGEALRFDEGAIRAGGQGCDASHARAWHAVAAQGCDAAT